MNYPSDFEPSNFLPRPRRRFRFFSSVETEGGHATGAEAISLDGSEAASRAHPALVLSRQPNLLWSLALLGIWFVLLVVVAVPVIAIGSALHLLPRLAQLQSNIFPKTSILIEALSYALALSIAVPLFTRAWQRPFTAGIHWAAGVARAHAARLLALGIAISVTAQLIESHLTLPKKIPMDAFFRTPMDVLIVAGFGTIIAPVAEEIFFRGFLLPGFAIAWDWLRLPHTPEARLQWQTTDTLSRAGLIFSGVLTSLLFAVLHAAQLGFAWNAVAVLWFVGGVLTAVRIRLKSVAASTLVHMAYNGFIFAVVIIATGGLRHLERLSQH